MSCKLDPPRRYTFLLRPSTEDGDSTTTIKTISARGCCSRHVRQALEGQGYDVGGLWCVN